MSGAENTLQKDNEIQVPLAKKVSHSIKRCIYYWVGGTGPHEVQPVHALLTTDKALLSVDS